jgi:hypothetical protein
MKPWIDRKILETEAEGFVKRNGYFLRTHAARISGLVEVAVYNSVVSFYEAQEYKLNVLFPGPKKSFVYRLKSSGLITGFSCFEAVHMTTGETVLILQNVKLQSAHDDHLYYTPDIVVCSPSGAITAEQKNGRRHSYVSKDGVLTFVEVKHLIPSPELLFSFSGLVLEFAPDFIAGCIATTRRAGHLTPILVFTGVPSEHSERIAQSLTKRYGVNIIFCTQKTEGRIASFTELNKYRNSQQSALPVTVTNDPQTGL